MNVTGKWLLRAGILFVVLGFVLPAMTVSCSGLPGLGQTFTLANITSRADQPLLYLVPIGAIVAGALSFLQFGSRTQQKSLFFAQIGCMALGLISMGGTYISLSNQIQQTGGFDIALEYGFFILLGGYLCAAIGLGLEWQNRTWHSYLPEKIPQQLHSPPAESATQTPLPHPDPLKKYPYLDPVQGNVVAEPVYLLQDSFQIGRGSDNDLQLQDAKVSRQHARLRYAQGAWFIQDQESAGGILVNQEPISATRIMTGDQIQIGDQVFIFHES